MTDALRSVYLDLLGEQARRYKLRLLAYCLMTNHVHLVVVPDLDDSMASAFRHAHGRFAQYWNAENHRIGHMWQNRYYSCPVENIAMWRVARYVEQNPVRAGLVDLAVSYEWSSAASHLGLRGSAILDTTWPGWPWPAAAWAAVLNDADAEAESIRKATFDGRPYGSAMFTESLEMRLGRQLDRRPGGRPRKLVASSLACY